MMPMGLGTDQEETYEPMATLWGAVSPITKIHDSEN
jgi:hypothetical protein